MKSKSIILTEELIYYNFFKHSICLKVILLANLYCFCGLIVKKLCLNNYSFVIIIKGYIFAAAIKKYY